ncbi:MAG: preprotein translocase subunit SecA, partial [Clostridiales bacterium]|nr:preprotein translocase subunit SecA [Clostridiales bacterium]
MKKLFEKIMGSYSDRELKRISPIVDEIESYEEKMKALSDADLKAYTDVYKKRISEGETLNDILPEVFATVREAGVRVLGQRAFRTQLVGGIVIHQGRIAEMKTGEGKTLMAVFSLYLNALEGKGAHLVTVNDYLAAYQGEMMGKVYDFLGMTTGVIIHGRNTEQRRAAYNSDITYGTNNEFGFDYLRDNMVIYKQNMVQRDHHYAIIDEVDSILIDEARTPLIISGPGEKSTDLYEKANAFARTLSKKVFAETDDKKEEEDFDVDYIVDEKAGSATLTEKGMTRAERYFGVTGLADPENMTLMHHINQSLKAHGTMKREKEYVVKNNEVIIIDEFTGRMMYGRRYSNGLHQAIEAKEGVKVERESKTLATITFQNYFRMYEKLSGMTGTALTEEEEFREIYGLDCIEVPTNKPMIRNDAPDAVYKTQKGKFEAVLKEVEEAHLRQQPMLIGTISIETSEFLSTLLRRRGIKHEVLNAKYHDREAEIVAQAGRVGSVTIATNMAGRGTDIMLGGNPEFMALQKLRKEGYDDHILIQATGFNETADTDIIEARTKFRIFENKFKEDLIIDKQTVIDSGGLYIIGTERHESRRIDNQLRGRSGRQGDPGKSKFFIALDDDLMRLFGQDRLTGIVNALGLPEDIPIEHKMLSNAIESAQKRVEGKNFNIRKHVLQYDDVMNKQREVIYDQRKKVLNGDNLRDIYVSMIKNIVDSTVGSYCMEEQDSRKWDWFSILAFLNNTFPSDSTIDVSEDERNGLFPDALASRIYDEVYEKYEGKEKEMTEKILREAERVILLRVVDDKWMDHIDAMDQLRQGIGLRAYGQRDPVVEYKFEGFEMFEDMNATIRENAVKVILGIKPAQPDSLKPRQRPLTMNASHGSKSSLSRQKKSGVKVGRNEPCPCG